MQTKATRALASSASFKPTVSQYKAEEEIKSKGYTIHYRAMRTDGSGTYVAHARFGELEVKFHIGRRGCIKALFKNYMDVSKPDVIASMIQSLPTGTGGRDE